MNLQYSKIADMQHKMTPEKYTQEYCEIFMKNYGAVMYDCETNLLWKIIDGKWVGKRSVWTHDRRVAWIEETTIENIKSWWCGKDADYNEIFYKDAQM